MEIHNNVCRAMVMLTSNQTLLIKGSSTPSSTIRDKVKTTCLGTPLSVLLFHLVLFETMLSIAHHILTYDAQIWIWTQIQTEMDIKDMTLHFWKSRARMWIHLSYPKHAISYFILRFLYEVFNFLLQNISELIKLSLFCIPS